MNQQLRTPEEAMEWLRSHGVSVTEFARRIGVKRPTIYRALAGGAKGHRGAAHKAAVALGLKPAPKGEPPFSLDQPSQQNRSEVRNFQPEVANLATEQAA